jgi:hypothetical protein
MTTLEQLKSVVRQLEQLDRISRKIDNGRNVYESVETTLDRILRERQAAQELVETIGFKAKPFDGYKRICTLESNLRQMKDEAINRREQKLSDPTQKGVGNNQKNSD